MIFNADPLSLVENLDKLSIKSAGCKYREVVVRVFDEWAESDIDFDIDIESHKVVSRTKFMDHFHGFLTSAMGGSSIPSGILTIEERRALIPKVKDLVQIFNSAYSRIKHTSDSDESYLEVKSEFVDEILEFYFTNAGSRIDSGFTKEVLVLDDWMAGIVAEVISASVFDRGYPEDSEHRVFSLMLEDKQTHTAAAFLIGTALLENWLLVDPLRNEISLGVFRSPFEDDE